jgi:hypothetical protein
MSQLKVMWDAMSPDEQLSYKKTNLPAVEEEEGETEGNLVDEPAHLVALRAHSTSLRIAESRVNKWMEDWQKKVSVCLLAGIQNQLMSVLFLGGPHSCHQPLRDSDVCCVKSFDKL